MTVSILRTPRARWLSSTVAASLALITLSACAGGAAEPTDGANDDEISIAALVAGTNVPYLAAYADAMQAAADELGAELKLYSADFDASKQAEQFSQAVNSGVDVIVVNAVDATAIVPSLLKAQQAGISVVASNNGVDDSGQELTAGYTGPDDILQGGIAAGLMVEAVGDSAQIAVIQGALGTSPQLNRSAGFEQGLADNATGVTILDSQTASWDKDEARTVAANFITRFGDELKGIFAQDDTMASGAAQAVADAGKTGQIAIIGLGGSTLGLEGVKDGSIFGTIIQSPVQDGTLAIQAAVDVAKGDSIPPTQYLEPIEVTKDNVDQFTAEW